MEMTIHMEEKRIVHTWMIEQKMATITYWLVRDMAGKYSVVAIRIGRNITIFERNLVASEKKRFRIE